MVPEPVAGGPLRVRTQGGTSQGLGLRAGGVHTHGLPFPGRSLGTHPLWAVGPALSWVCALCLEREGCGPGHFPGVVGWWVG